MKILPDIRLWRKKISGKAGSLPGSAETRQRFPLFAGFDWLKIGLTILTIILLSALMTVNLLPDKISLRLGERSPHEVRAKRTVIYVNSTQTALTQQAARLATRPVYDIDEHASATSIMVTRDFYDRVDRERALLGAHAGTASLEKSITKLDSEFSGTFSRTQLRSLLTLSPSILLKLRDVTIHQVGMAMTRDIHDTYDISQPSNDLIHAQQDIAIASRSSLSSENSAIVSEAAGLALRPNRIYNARKYSSAQEERAHAVQPVYEQIVRGDKLIGAGERVTEDHLDKFTALGLLNPKLEIATGAGICLLAMSMVLLVVVYLNRTMPELAKDTRRLALLALIVLISVFGLKVGGTLLGLSISSGQVGYLGMMSVVAAGMMVSVLLDMNLAVLIVALLSVQSGLIMNHEIRFTVMTLMSSIVGIACTGGRERKSNLPLITGALAGTNLVLVWLLGMILRESLTELWTGSLWAVGSAAFATFLYWFGVLAVEKPFGILTHSSLLELSATDRPLLRELCMAAPGTYAHSIMVGTLAEAGAQEIGADPLLCRVGGYYHDIGKIKRPEFFIENQRDMNVHGRLSPSLSALIITAHVRDGVEMAHEYRLPKEIRDIIEQHHGTTLIRYFYHQAVSDIGGSDDIPPGLEERFRYAGPKPQTREAGVIMLADSVEAAGRSLVRPSQEQVAELIANIIRDKMEDRQLDECKLTFRDVKQITDAFLRVLTAMMHSRIDYPKEFPATASRLPMEVAREDLRILMTEPGDEVILNVSSFDDQNSILMDENRQDSGVQAAVSVREISDPIGARPGKDT